MKASLQVGPEVYNLIVGTYLIGKSSIDVDHDITIDDESVDVKHAVLEITSEGAQLADCYSKNGTEIDAKKIVPIEKINLPPTASIKFGNVECDFKITVENRELSSTRTSINTSDFIPASPERDDHHRFNKIRERSRKHITTSSFATSPSTAAGSAAVKIDIEENANFLIPATQNFSFNSEQNTAALALGEKINENIEFLQNDDDDFCIPETQESFKIKSVTEPDGSIIKGENIDVVFRLDTMDFNGDGDYQSIQSENLLNGFDQASEVIPLIRPPIAMTDGTDNFYDTDCEEEMSALKWNESSIPNKTPNNLVQDAVITGGENLSKVNEEASVTPDLDEFKETDIGKKIPSSESTGSDFNQNGKKQSSDNKEVSSEMYKSKKANSSMNSTDNKRDEKTKNSDRSGSATPELDENSFVLQKKCVASLETANSDSDEDIESTQIFDFNSALENMNKSKSTQGKISIYSNKENLLSLAQVKNSTKTDQQVFAMPKIPNMRSNDSTKNISTPKMNNLDVGNMENEDEEDEDIFLAPTQIFTSTAKKDTSEASQNFDDDSFDFAPTQLFPIDQYQANTSNTRKKNTSVAKLVDENEKAKPISKRISSRSATPPILDSDDEDFRLGLQATLPVDEIFSTKKTAEKQKSIEKKGKNKIIAKPAKVRCNLLFGSSDEDESDETNGVKGGTEAMPAFNFEMETPQIEGFNLGSSNLNASKAKDQPSTSRVQQELSTPAKSIPSSPSSSKFELEWRERMFLDTNTPVCCFKLPDPEQIRAAGDAVRQVFKNQKHTKLLLEDDEEDELFKINAELDIEMTDAKRNTKGNKKDNKIKSKDKKSKIALQQEHIELRSKDRNKKNQEGKPIADSKDKSHDEGRLKTHKKDDSTIIFKESGKKTENKEVQKKAKARPEKLKASDKTKSKNKSEEVTADKETNTKSKRRRHDSETRSEDDEKMSVKSTRSTRATSTCRSVLDKEEDSTCDKSDAYSKRTKKGNRPVTNKKDSDYVDHHRKASTRNKKTPTRLQNDFILEDDQMSGISSASTRSRRGQHAVSTCNLLSNDDELQKTRNDSDKKSKSISKSVKTQVKAKSPAPVIKKSSKKRQNDSSTDEVGPEKKPKETSITESDSSLGETGRKSARIQNKLNVIFTKVNSEQYAEHVKSIGGYIVDNPSDCNLLITQGVFRTWKFLACLAKGTPIVTPQWLETAHSTKNKKLPVQAFLVNDPVSEKRFKFKLQNSIERAQKRGVFVGYTFIITPNTKPPPHELTRIIECGGGTVVSEIPEAQDNFYVISDKVDLQLWPTLRRRYRNLQIIHSEGIMMAVLQQKIYFKYHILS